MTMIAVVNGPNLNVLGSRETRLYGAETWEEIRSGLEGIAGEMDLEIEFFQSNHEGAMIDHIQEMASRAQGMIINPGALTHYSYSLRDALASLPFQVIEVHITNIYAREEWRSRSVISPVASGVISGFGPRVYEMALIALSHILQGKR
jgi:3-dehydroquinate dehydratase II